MSSNRFPSTTLQIGHAKVYIYIHIHLYIFIHYHTAFGFPTKGIPYEPLCVYIHLAHFGHQTEVAEYPILICSDFKCNLTSESR